MATAAATATNSDRRDSSAELLHELEALSQSLFPPDTSRRTASLILDRSSVQTLSVDISPVVTNSNRRAHHISQSQRLPTKQINKQINKHDSFLTEATASRERKGLWNWKPIRAISHIGMQRIGCLFSVKVISVRALPASTNGRRLCVAVRKKETKKWATRTTPSRVIQGSAEFEETLFVQCHLHYNGKPPVFEPRLFVVSVLAVGAPELDLGRNIVDLSRLVKESIERSFEGERVREWDMKFKLSGAAELVLKLGFHIMEGAAVSIFGQAEKFAKKAYVPPSSRPSVQMSEAEWEVEEVDEFNSGEIVENSTNSREAVKEVVHQRLTDLESIADEIKNLEFIMTRDVHQLNSNEESVTRKFLQMLDHEEPGKSNMKASLTADRSNETRILSADLGKGLGPVVQTKDGGYVASMNPFNMRADREEVPKLAIQISRPFILQDQKQESGLEVYQRLAAIGALEELTAKLLSLTTMDELTGKTAEQIAFEGVASAIISGRNREGASSSAARSITTVKMMAKAMVEGGKGPVTWDEVVAFSMPKIAEMAVEGVEIEAGTAKEEAPFDVPYEIGQQAASDQLLDSAISLEEWLRASNDSNDHSLQLLMAIQLRDPVRQYEPVGGAQIVVLEAVRVDDRKWQDEEEERFEVRRIHVGGVKLRSGEGQRQRLSALQWLTGMGIGKEGPWNKKFMETKIKKDVLWSLSSGLKEDLWAKPMRNPNVILNN